MPVVKHHNASVSLSAGKSISLQLKIGSIDEHSNLNLFFLRVHFLPETCFDMSGTVISSLECGRWVGVGGVGCFNI